jgi:capsular polysaccharide biosynthesis protein
MLKAEILFDSHKINYALPSNFREEDRSLFYEENFVNDIPAVYMYVLENVTASNAALIKKFRVLDQFTHHQFLSSQKKARIVIRKMLTSSINMDVAINGFQDWADNYFHWITELLPRIHAMHILNPDIPVLINQRVSQLSFVHMSLNQLQIPFIPLISGRNINTKKMFVIDVPHVGRFSEPLLQNLRQTILKSFALVNTKPPFRRIYVSRNQARRRKISNEDEVWQCLQSYGFERFELEAVSWSEQVRFFSEASVVLASHGAGLTNIMFMNEGTHVIELKASNNNYWCYFSLARVFGLQYTYLLCKGDIEDHRNADIKVDLQAFSTLLTDIDSIKI